MKETLTFGVPDEYPWIVLCTLLICFQCSVFAGIFPGRMRGKVFTPEFMG